jgi:hypothetical protein
VWPEDAQTVTCFLRLQNQWRVSYGMDGLPMHHGLDMNAGAAMINLLKIRDKQDMLDHLLVMEMSALPVIRECIAEKRKR